MTCRPSAGILRCRDPGCADRRVLAALTTRPVSPSTARRPSFPSTQRCPEDAATAASAPLALQPRVLVLRIARDLGVALRRARRTADRRSRARSPPRHRIRRRCLGSRSCRRAATEECGVPSPLGDAHARRRDSGCSVARSEGLKRHPTTAILHGFPEWLASRRMYAAPWCNWQHA